MKKVIVTGATGMIGASMIEFMLKDDIEITAVIRPASKKRGNLPEHENIKVIECDIGDLHTLGNVLEHDYDTFYQFVEGELSDAIPKNPVTGYGIAKYAANKLSKLYCERYGIRHSWGRIVSTYGPRDNDYTMVMSSVIGMLRGERMRFTRGDQIWDYVYGGDCAKAFYLIGKFGKHGKAYTIASGKSRLLRDYIKDIRDVIDPSLEIGLGEKEYYPNQVMRLTANIDELREDTGFFPEVDFKEGIQRTVKWYKGEQK